MNFYPFHIGDYVSATAHLSMTEDGAYRRLLDAYYTREAPLPADVAACCRLVRATSREERRAAETVLREFFSLGESGWTHSRCDAEIARAASKRTKAADSANKRWHSERNANAYANAYANACEDSMRTHSEGNAPNTNTNKNTPLPPEAGGGGGKPPAPDWLPAEAWAGYLAMRKRKASRAPFTDRARALVLAELQRLRADGHDVAGVLDQSVRNGWTDVYPVKAGAAGKPAVSLMAGAI